MKNSTERNKTRELFELVIVFFIGLMHFFFGRTIIAFILQLLEVALFWIIGSVIVLYFIAVLVYTLMNNEQVERLKKWCEKDDCIEVEIELNDDDNSKNE